MEEWGVYIYIHIYMQRVIIQSGFRRCHLVEFRYREKNATDMAWKLTYSARMCHQEGFSPKFNPAYRRQRYYCLVFVSLVVAHTPALMWRDSLCSSWTCFWLIIGTLFFSSVDLTVCLSLSAPFTSKCLNCFRPHTEVTLNKCICHYM